MSFNYDFLFDYLPSRYTATPTQEQNRHLVYAFKDGNYSLGTRDELLQIIQKINSTKTGVWGLCFIPAGHAVVKMHSTPGTIEPLVPDISI